jgi:hypothetical protein
LVRRLRRSATAVDFGATDQPSTVERRGSVRSRS